MKNEGAPVMEAVSETTAAESVDSKKESLRSEFLPALEEALFEEHLTVEQLRALVDRAAGLTAYDDAPIDHFYIKSMDENERGGMINPQISGLRGQGAAWMQGDILLADVMEEVFAPIHRKGLKSDQKRHDDGLRYDSIDITGSMITELLGRILKRTEEFRENDTTYEYNKGVLASYVSHFADNNWVTFESAVTILDTLEPEGLSLSLQELDRYLSKRASEGTRPKGDVQAALSFLEGLPSHLGADIGETPTSTLRDILKTEFLKREKESAEAAAKKGNNFEI